ncbi:MAG: hypothetical protein UT63_C0036G0006 [Candidatus Gottesmanbacteria bacterium GW2011_GWC2_39_8]|uniref:Glycosyltransferase RgtA/B/C/D-like domain-containing protein n=1 Tax=Candidatus Gottesmanbacteria bacterium GW2011_GWC2_39_8 TaxID=1618450 RepID=A0A0G0T4C8_9BACT|nr:MAG: hypothetical protein UT63_C0036G0006 [Candidatus Gottesmanbacteria bacterium GW2011_GWC2_39_8]
MNILKKLVYQITSDLFFFLVIAFAMMGISLYPTIFFVLHSPPDRVFPFLHNNAADFYYYLTLMNQGANGNWLAFDYYTTETLKPSLIEVFFVYLGKFGSLFHLSMPLTYFFSRLIFGTLFFFFAFYLIGKILPRGYRKIAFLLTVIAGPVIKTSIVNGKVVTSTFLDWWTGIDPVHRASFLPHHLLGNALLLVSIIFLFNYFRKKQTISLLWAGFASSFAGFIHPPNVIILILTTVTTIFIYLIKEIINQNKVAGDAREGPRLRAAESEHRRGGTGGRTRGMIRFFLPLTIFCFFSGLPVLILLSQTTLGFPWSIIPEWETKQFYPLSEELLGGLGPIFLFSLIGIFWIFQNPALENIFIGTWAFLPLICIYFSNIFHLNAVRFLQGAPFVPLSIMTGFSLLFLGKKISKSHFKNSLKYLIYGITLIILLSFYIPALKVELSSQIAEYTPIYSNIYLTKTTFAGLEFINKNIPPKTHILSSFYTGNYIPAFTDNVSFLGHHTYTYNLEQKQAALNIFYGGKMTDAEAKQFLDNYKITLIWQGWDEKSLKPDALPLYPNLLKVAYQNPDVTLYILK